MSSDGLIKAVVFDMDGVLFDSERITRIMWAQAGKEFNIDDVAASVKDCTGCCRKDQYVYLRNKYGADFPAEKFRDRCSQLFCEYVKENGLPLMPYAKEILVYLKARGYRLALASSTRTETVYRELTEASLIDFFEQIVCGDDVEHSKPAPDIYLKACELLSLSPKECAAVEDSPNGIKSSFAAGLKPIMVPDQIQPDDQIKSMLYSLCTSLEALKNIF